LNATIFKEEEEEEDKKEDERDDTPRGLGLQTKGLGFESKKKKKEKGTLEDFGSNERTHSFLCVDNKITPVITTESELGLAEPWFPSLKVTLLSRLSGVDLR
jgi:hypothetical protein